MAPTSPSRSLQDDESDYPTMDMDDYWAYGTMSISIKNRSNAFNEKLWWMVDTKSEDVPTRQGATPIVRRCMRKFGWSETFCRRVLLNYKQFLTIKKEHQDWDCCKFAPCQHVDLLWLEHASDTTNYLHDCFLLCGQIVDRDPDAFLDAQRQQEADQVTRQALMERFGKYYDADMWLNRVKPSSSSSSGATRGDAMILKLSRDFCNATTNSSSSYQASDSSKNRHVKSVD